MFIRENLKAEMRAIIAKHGKAYVTFNVFYEAIRVSAFGPGSWAAVTIVYHADGKSVRY